MMEEDNVSAAGDLGHPQKLEHIPPTPPSYQNQNGGEPLETTNTEETTGETTTGEKTETTHLVETNSSWDQGCPSCMKINFDLFFYKLFFLTFLGALGCILPYLSVYFKQLGFSPEVIGLVFGVRPLVGFISAALWGMIADRFRIRRILFIISIFAWVGMIVGLGFLSAPTKAKDCPVELTKQLNETNLAMKDSNDTTTGKPVIENLDDEWTKDIGWIYEPQSLKKVVIFAALLVLGGELVQSPTSTFADTGTFTMLGDNAAEGYGAQRAWGAVGWGSSVFVSGALISSTRYSKIICGVEITFSNYRYFVYVFLAVVAFGVFSATQMKFEANSQKKDDSRPNEIKMTETGADEEESATKSKTKLKKQIHSMMAVLKVFRNWHYGSWIFVVFIMGASNGLIWGFLFWHLDNLGATQLLMGAAAGVSCCSEFIMFFFVNFLIVHLGHIPLLHLALLSYVIRFVVYGLIENPWLVLPAEILQGITFSCTWVSMLTYASKAVPSVSLASIMGILQGVYFGLGVGVGKMAGGLLIGQIGASYTFFVYGGMCTLVLGWFILIQKVCVKPTTAQFFYENMDEECETKP